MSLESLAKISRFYGKNPDYVLAGGGNSSWKDGQTLYVKGSGMYMADAVPGSFVKMDREALSQVWEKKYPDSSAERESAVLSDIMAARKPGEDKRPSVETLLHDIMPFSYVMHLHPALVNGVTCSRRGEEALREIFGGEVLWIPICNPGYVLSKKVKTAMEKFSKGKGAAPEIIFLQNHGVFVGANDTDGVKKLYDGIMSNIGALIKRKPDFSDEKIITNSSLQNPALGEAGCEIMRLLEKFAGAAAFTQSLEISSLVKDRASFAPVSSAFTPDHIVYAGSDPLFTEEQTTKGIRRDFESHAKKTGGNPKIIAVQGLGVFGVGAPEKTALLALELFKDSVKVAVYAESFGGHKFMTKEQIDFINGWEAERFRVSTLSR